MLKGLIESLDFFDLNKKHVIEVLQRPLYLSNPLFQEYVAQKGFDRALKCRIHDEKVRRNETLAKDKNHLRKQSFESFKYIFDSMIYSPNIEVVSSESESLHESFDPFLSLL